MDKALKPDRFDVNPNIVDAAKRWRHWLLTFENFIAILPQENMNKLQILINFVSPDVFDLFCNASSYEEAIATLKTLYVKTPNEIFARHSLASQKQLSGETLDEYLQALKTLSKECNFRQVTASEYRDEAIRDAFISGLSSNNIRQRLLENKTLDLQTAFDQARTLDIAQKNSESYQFAIMPSTAATSSPYIANTPTEETIQNTTAASIRTLKCFFCGYSSHPRSKCPAREAICGNCQKKGHYQKVCKSKPHKEEPTSAALNFPTLAMTKTVASKSLSKACVNIYINQEAIEALVDSGSSDNFIHPLVVQQLQLKKFETQENVSMAASSLFAKMQGYCIIDIHYNKKLYAKVKFYILPDLCADIILGQNWQSRHKSVTINYGGAEAPVKICSLATLNVTPPSLFRYLTKDVHPIATKSRKYSQDDQEFIVAEINRLLNEGIIEPSDSPWRAQVVVCKNEKKKRMVIDYSQTINRFTQLDAYPLPRIDETVNKIAQYRVFSTIDLKSAYHQVPIKEEEKKYTAFEANHHLYQFCRVPFGVTNGVAAFQRTITDFILEESLEDTFAYLDDITICGKDQAHHDKNLKRFLAAAKKKNLTYNEEKCKFSTKALKILGCYISEGEIRPDPDRLQPLRDLPPPTNMKDQKRVIGFFSYYSKWIKDFSRKLKPLIQNEVFPLESNTLEAFNALKFDIENSVVCAIDEAEAFQIETDSSEFALAATLNQNGRPIAFF